jgi:MFS family permease
MARGSVSTRSGARVALFVTSSIYLTDQFVKHYFRNMSFRSGRAALWTAVLAKAVSFFGDQVATVALLLRLQQSGAGAPAVAGLLMAGLAPVALLSPVAGRLVDRYSSRALLGVSGVVQAGVCTGLVLASGTPATLALVAALGVGQAVNGATWQALLPSLVAPAQLARALGLAQAATTAGMIAAPAVGGLLTAWAGARPALALDAATFVLVALAGLVVPARRPAPAPGRLPGGLALVRRDPLLRATVALLTLFVLLGATVNVVEVFLVRVTLHASSFWYGLVGAAYAAGVFAGALVGGRLPGTGALARAFVVSATLLGAGLAGMGLAPDERVLFAVSLAAGACNGVLNVATSALVFGRARADERGRVAAFLGGATSGAELAAYAIGGGLAGVLAPRAIFVLAGVLGAAAPLLAGRAVLRSSGSCAVPGVVTPKSAQDLRGADDRVPVPGS